MFDLCCMVCDTNCRLEDTLYLDVTAPTIRPGLLVTSDHGRTAVEFGSVGTGESGSICCAMVES